MQDNRQLLKTVLRDFTVHCDCDVFYDGLNVMNSMIFHYIQQREQQWDKLEESLLQYLQKNFNVSASTVSSKTLSCSYVISSTITDNLENARRSGIFLSNLIVNLRTIMSFKNCVSKHMHLIWDYFDTTTLSPIECRNMSNLPSNVDFLKFLLKFNFVSSFPEHYFQREKDYMQTIYFFIFGILDFGIQTRDFCACKVTKDMMKLLEASLFLHYERRERNKKIFLIGMAMLIIHFNLRKEHYLANQYLRCLRMYFTASNDPLLTKFEVKSALYACLFVVDQLHLFGTCSEEFNKMMPECPLKMEPRRLVDLARCKVRHTLDLRNPALPAVLEGLRLPKHLNSFLMGDDNDIPRHTENVASQEDITQEELSAFFSEKCKSIFRVRG